MRKIRIGNDIRLKLSIKPNEQAGFDKIDEMDMSSIKQLRCYLINTSWNRLPDPDEPLPFKRVGFPEYYMPQHHNINNAGFPSYNMLPANLHNYDRFVPDFHGYHWWPGYRGFGIHPERFHGGPHHHVHNHLPHPYFGDPYGPRESIHHNPFITPEPTEGPCWEPYHPDFVPIDIYGKPAEDHSHQNPWSPWYLADSQVVHESNVVTCFFPAVQQRLCGKYKLVIVLTVFEQGWGRHNLRTYTIDKGEIFELVDDGGESGNIFVDVDDTGERENVFESLWSSKDLYIIPSNSQLPLGKEDLQGYEYNIYAKLKDGSIVLFNPRDWHFTELTFKSSDESILTVGKDGTLYAKDIADPEEEVTVTVEDIDRNVSCEFRVIVKYLDTILMGFDPTENIQEMSSENETIKPYSVKKGTYVVHNPENGYYLWVFSQRKIHYIKSTEDNNELAAELSSGFRVPMTNCVIKDGYFCYRSVAPILADDMRIKIKFENEIQ